MNDGTDHATVVNPLTNPHAAPTPSAANTPAQTGHPRPATRTPSTDPASASPNPTDRSTPPATITNVIPTATTVRSGTSLISVRSVPRVKKLLLSDPNSPASATSTASIASTS